MKLYTSYFAQLRNFPPTLVGCSTTVWNPRWLQKGRDKNGALWIDCPPLKPGHSCDGLCNGKCNPKHPNDCQFLIAYKQQLDKIDFQKFIANLSRLEEQIKQEENLSHVDFAFLVYETPQNPCSERRIIQQWLCEHGIEVSEWKK